MLHHHVSALSILAASVLASSGVAVPAHAAVPDAVCKTVIAANSKQYMTPSHVVETGKDPGESIFIGNSVYLKDGGKWKRVPVTPQWFQQQLQEEVHDASVFSCRHLRDDAVNGEPANVYSVQIDNHGVKFDLQEWISKSRGLLLKKEGTTDADGVKSNMSAHYDYSNVQAPAGVQ